MSFLLASFQVADSHSQFHNDVSSHSLTRPETSIKPQSEQSLRNASVETSQAQLQVYEETSSHNLIRSQVESPPQDKPEEFIQSQSKHYLRDVFEELSKAQRHIHKETSCQNLSHSQVESPPQQEPDSSIQTKSEPSLRGKSEESTKAQLQVNEDTSSRNLTRKLGESTQKDEAESSTQTRSELSLADVSEGPPKAQLRVHDVTSSHNSTRSPVKSPPQEESESSIQTQSEPSLSDVSQESSQAQPQVHDVPSSVHLLTHTLVENSSQDEPESPTQDESEHSPKPASEESSQTQKQVHNVTEQAWDDTSPTGGSSNSSMAQPDEEYDFNPTFVRMLIDFESTAVSSNVSDQDIDMESLLNQNSTSHNHPHHDDASASVPIPNLALHSPPMQMIAQEPSIPFDVPDVQQNAEQFDTALPLNSSLENGQSQDEIFTFDESSSERNEQPNEDHEDQECDSDLTIVTMLSDFESTAESIDISDLDIDLESIFKQDSDLDNQSTKGNAPIPNPTPDYQASLLQMADQEASNSFHVPENAEQFDIELLLNSISESVQSQEEISSADEIHSLEFYASPLQMTAQLPSSSINMPADAEQDNINLPLNSSSENVPSRDETSADSSLDLHEPSLPTLKDPTSSSITMPDMPANAEQFNIEIPVNSNSENVQSQDDTSSDSSLDLHEPSLPTLKDPTSSSITMPDMPANAEQFNIEIPVNSNSENVQSQDDTSSDSSLDLHEPPLPTLKDPTSSSINVPDMPADAEQFNIEIPVNSKSENVKSKDEISPKASLRSFAFSLEIITQTEISSIDVSDIAENEEQFDIELPLNSSSENVHSQDKIQPNCIPEFHAIPLQKTVQPESSSIDMAANAGQYNIKLHLNSSSENLKSRNEILPNPSPNSHAAPTQIIADTVSSFTDALDTLEELERCNIEPTLDSSSESMQSQDEMSTDPSPDFHAPPLEIKVDPASSSFDVSDVPEKPEQFNIEPLLNSSSESMQSQDEISPNVSLNFHAPPMEIKVDPASSPFNVADLPANGEQFSTEMPLNSSSESMQSQDEMPPNACLSFHVPPMEIKVDPASSPFNVPDVPANGEQFSTEMPLNSSSESMQSQNEMSPNACLSFHVPPLEIKVDPASSSFNVSDVPANGEQFSTEMPLNSSSESMQSQDEMSPNASLNFHVPPPEKKVDPAWNQFDIPDMPANEEQFDTEILLNSSSESMQSQDEMSPNASLNFHVPPPVKKVDPTWSPFDVPDMPANEEQFDTEILLNSSSESMQSHDKMSPNASLNFHAPPMVIKVDPASSPFNVPDVPANGEQFDTEILLNSSSESMHSQDEISPNASLNFHAPPTEIKVDPTWSPFDVPDVPANEEQFDTEIILNSSSESTQSQDEMSPNASLNFHAPPTEIKVDPASSPFDAPDMPANEEQFSTEVPLNSNPESMQSQDETSPNASLNFHVPPLDIKVDPTSSSFDVPDMAANGEQFSTEVPLNSSSERMQSHKDISKSDQSPSPEIYVPSLQLTAQLPKRPPDALKNAEQFDTELSLNSTSEFIPTQAGISTSDESSSLEICAPLQMTVQLASSSFDMPNVAATPEQFDIELQVNSSSESVDSHSEKSASDDIPSFGKRIDRLHRGYDFDLTFDTMQSDIQSTEELTDISDLNIDMESILNQNSKSDNQSTEDEASNSYPSRDLHAPPWQMMAHSVSNSCEMAEAPENAEQFDMQLPLDSNSETMQMSNLCSNLITKSAAPTLPLSMPLVPPLILEDISKDNIELSPELDYDSASDLDMEFETDTLVDSDEYSSADDSSSTIILTCRSLKSTRDMELIAKTTDVQESLEDNSYSLKLPVSDSIQDTQFIAQTTKVQDWIEDNYSSPKLPVSDSTQDTEFMAQTTMVQESIDEHTDSHQSTHQTDVGHEDDDFESIVEDFLDEVHSSQESVSKETSEYGATVQESIAKDSADHDAVSQRPMDFEAIDEGSMADNSTHYTATDKEPLSDLPAAPRVMQQDILEPDFKGFDQQPEDQESIDKEDTNQKLLSLKSTGQGIFNTVSFDENGPNEESVNDELVDKEPTDERSIEHPHMTQLPLDQHATDKMTIGQEITNDGSANHELVNQDPTDGQSTDHPFMIQLYIDQDATYQVPIYQAIAINDFMCDNAMEPQHVSQESLEQEQCEEQSCYQKSVIQLSLDRQAIDQVPYDQDVAITESMSYKAVGPDKMSHKFLEQNRRDEQSTDHHFITEVSPDQDVTHIAFINKYIAINEYVSDKAVNPQRLSEKSLEQHRYEEQSNDQEIMIKLSLDQDTAIAETVNDKTADLENEHHEFLEQNRCEEQFSDQELSTNYAIDEEFTDQEFINKLSTNQDAIGEDSADQESMTKQSPDEDSFCEEFTDQESMNKQSPDEDSFCEEFTDLDLTDNYETCEESIESMPDALIQEICIDQQSIDQISSQQQSSSDESSDHGSVENTPQEFQYHRLLDNEEHDGENGDAGYQSDWIDDRKNINHRLISTLATGCQFAQSEGKYSLDLNPQRDKIADDEDELSFEYHSCEDSVDVFSIQRNPPCDGDIKQETTEVLEVETQQKPKAKRDIKQETTEVLEVETQQKPKAKRDIKQETTEVLEVETQQKPKAKQSKAQVILDSRSIDFRSVLQQFNKRIAIQQRALEGHDVNKELAEFDESACKRNDVHLKQINKIKSNFMSFGSDALEPNDADLINPPTKFKDWHQQCQQQQQEKTDPLDPDPKPPPTVDHNPTTFKTAYMNFRNLEAKEMEDECSELSSKASIDSEDWITHRSNLSDVSTESGLWMNIDQKFFPLLKSEIQFIDSEFRECSSPFNSPRIFHEHQNESPSEMESLCDCEESNEEDYLERVPIEKESLEQRSIDLGSLERGPQRHELMSVGFLEQGPQEHGPMKLGSLNRGYEVFESLNEGSLKRGAKSHRASMNLPSLERGHRYQRSSKHISMISKYMEQTSFEEGFLNEALTDQEYEYQEFMNEHHLDIKEDMDL